MACGSSPQVAATKAGISKRTAQRRTKDPVFKQQLEALRAEIRQRAVGVVTATMLESIKTLVTLQGELYPPAVRLGAARALLEIGMKIREQEDLAKRVLDLLQQLRAAVPAAAPGPPSAAA
jgi:hypothetical protein